MLAYAKMADDTDDEVSPEARALGSRIMIIRELRGLSRDDLVKGTGASSATVIRAEQKGAAKAAYVQQLCLEYGISADWLLCGRLDAPLNYGTDEVLDVDKVWSAAVDALRNRDLRDRPISQEVADRILRRCRESGFKLEPDPIAQASEVRDEIERQRGKHGPARAAPEEEPPADRFRRVLLAHADKLRKKGRDVPAAVVERAYAANHSHLEHEGDMEAFAAKVLNAELEGPKPGQVAKSSGVMKGGVPRAKPRGR